MAMARKPMPGSSYTKPIAHFTAMKGEPQRNAAGRLILGERRMEQLERALRNYERRTKRHIKEYYGEVTPETMAKYQRMMGDSRPVGFTVDISSITSVKAFNDMIKFLNRDKTKEYKKQLTEDRRSWLRKTVEHTLDIDRESHPEIFDAIDHMSAHQIMLWATRNPEFVQKLFYKYEEVWDTVTHNEWVRYTNEFIDSLKPFIGEREIPYVA